MLLKKRIRDCPIICRSAKTPNLPSGKLLHNYGKSLFLMGKFTISMAIFNSELLVYQMVNTL